MFSTREELIINPLSFNNIRNNLRENNEKPPSKPLSQPITTTKLPHITTKLSDQFIQTDQKIKEITQTTEETKQIMANNVQKIIERGEKLEVLEEKSEEILQASQNFKENATSLKRKSWWEEYRMPLIVTGGVSTTTLATLVFFIL